MLRRTNPIHSKDHHESSLLDDTQEVVYKNRSSSNSNNKTNNNNNSSSSRRMQHNHSHNRIKKSELQLFLKRVWIRVRSLPLFFQITVLVSLSVICGLNSMGSNRQIDYESSNTYYDTGEAGGSRRIRIGGHNIESQDSNSITPRFPAMVEVPMGEHGSDLSSCHRVHMHSSYNNIPKGRSIRYNENAYDTGPYKERSPLKKGDSCELMGNWQDTHHPSCLQFHEIQLNQFFIETQTASHTVKRDYSQESLRFLDNGAYRDVWMFRHNDGTRMALKTLRWSKKRLYDPRNYERHRKDAVAMEQLTASPYIVDIRGFCGNSALFDLSTGGDLYDLVEEGPAKDEMIRVAHRVAASVADAHHYNSQGHATIAHTDIKPDQFIVVNGDFKLNDFNRARFLTWNSKKDEHCGFRVQKNGGQWRSPEEFRYDDETEKVDVYSLGNVLHFMLTGLTTFHPNESNAKDFVLQGDRPPIHKLVANSKDPYNIAMVKAIRMCWEENPKKRASAREVADVLKEGLDKIKAEEI